VPLEYKQISIERRLFASREGEESSLVSAGAHKSISSVLGKVLAGAIKNLQQSVQHVSKNKLTNLIKTEENFEMFTIV
jgi:hypothetical protein